MKYSYFILSVFFLLSQDILSHKTKVLTDSLKKYSYQDLIDKVSLTSSKDSLLCNLYVKEYLKRAKLENNDREIIYGYDLFAQTNNNYDEALKYSDISIQLANKKYPKALPYLYLTKGNIFYTKNQLKEALNCFLISDSYQTELSILKNKIDYMIGLIKKTQGKYDEALQIYKKCLENSLKIDDVNYVRYILGLGEIYERTNNINEAEVYIKLGISECNKNLQNSFYLCYFIANRGKINFKEKKYQQAILDLKKSLSLIEKNNDYSNFSENCFYIGECYYALHQEKNAISYYKKVDSIFKYKSNIALLTIPCYNKIIDYYKRQNEYKKVIYYSDQFIKADKLLDDDYKYILYNVTKKYDIKKIILSKEEVISKLNNSRFFLFLGALTLLVTGMVFFIIMYRNKKKEMLNQKKLFDEYIMQKQIETKEEHIPIKIKESTLENLNENVIDNLIHSLKNFELTQGFLNNELTIEILAYDFKTNSNYLSRFINETKGLSFTQYINFLRINYIINKLETDKKYLAYSIQALSNISGFNSPQTFTRAFIGHTKIKPSGFIKQLKNKLL